MSLSKGVAAKGLLIGAVVLSPRPVGAQARWTIDRQPIFNVGGESDDTLTTFGQVRGVTRLANGQVVVADQKNYALRYFSPAGRFLRAVGRRGEGPGEFKEILRMIRCGDSLFVAEFGTDRWSVFSVTHGFARTFFLKSPQHDPRNAGPATPYDIACNSNGDFVSYGWATTKPGVMGAARPDAPFWLSRSDGAVSHVLGSYPGSERWNYGRSGSPRPLGKETAIAIGRTRVYVGTADSFAIMAFDLAGKPLSIIRGPNSTVRVESSDIKRYIMLDTIGQSAGLIRARLQMYVDMKYPTTLPAYSALIVDVVDNLWVQRYPRAADTNAHWFVFSPTGAEAAQVDLPLNLTVAEIGKDYVLGVMAEPSDGIQHVEVLRLTRGVKR